MYVWMYYVLYHYVCYYYYYYYYCNTLYACMENIINNNLITHIPLLALGEEH